MHASGATVQRTRPAGQIRADFFVRFSGVPLFNFQAISRSTATRRHCIYVTTYVLIYDCNPSGPAQAAGLLNCKCPCVKPLRASWCSPVCGCSSRETGEGVDRASSARGVCVLSLSWKSSFGRPVTQLIFLPPWRCAANDIWALRPSATGGGSSARAGWERVC